MKIRIGVTARFERVMEIPDECRDYEGACEWLADHE